MAGQLTARVPNPPTDIKQQVVSVFLSVGWDVRTRRPVRGSSPPDGRRICDLTFGLTCFFASRLGEPYPANPNTRLPPKQHTAPRQVQQQRRPPNAPQYQQQRGGGARQQQYQGRNQGNRLHNAARMDNSFQQNRQGNRNNNQFQGGGKGGGKGGGNAKQRRQQLRQQQQNRSGQGQQQFTQAQGGFQQNRSRGNQRPPQRNYQNQNNDGGFQRVTR